MRLRGSNKHQPTNLDGWQLAVGLKVCGEMDQGGRISGGWRWVAVGADVGQTRARQFTPTMHVQHLVGVTVRHPNTFPCMRRSHAPTPLPSSHMPRPYCSPSAAPPARPPAAPAGRGRVAGWPARAGSCDHHCALTCAHPHPGNVACFSAASLPRVVGDSWYCNNTMRTKGCWSCPVHGPAFQATGAGR